MGSSPSALHDRPKSIDNPALQNTVTRLHQPKSIQKRKVVILGLDNSGKTTLAEQLQRPEQVSSGGIPDTQSTIGINYVNLEEYNIQLFDLAGSERFQTIWDPMLREKDAIVFCIDLEEKDPRRLELIELWIDVIKKHVTKHKDTLLFVLGTKSDLAPPDCYNWADKGVKVRRINCQDAKKCHAFMKDVVKELNAITRDYERPPPIVPAKQVESESPRPFCKWPFW